ncbi:MAG TPA: GntR family transcriptional regulator [Candidatus Limnocylindrales bacterium]|jgi:hypothetical protein|nr:GntR family transcriptional regulator [Candidatus Limnocylindrales bacterium]
MVATGGSMTTARYRLPRVLARNLSDEVYAILRAAILAHEIEPGARLVEAELATELGVSRARSARRCGCSSTRDCSNRFRGAAPPS